MNCPKCNSEMKLRDGRYGKFWGCNSYPNCNQIVKYTGKEQQTTKIELKKIENPSSYQQAVFNWVLKEDGFAVVTAAAGSGKTTTVEHIVALLKEIGVTDVCYSVFNAHVRDSAIAKGLPAMTTHQMGLAAITQHLGKRPKIDSSKVNRIIKNLIQETWDTDKWLISNVSNIVSKLKNTLAPVDAPTIAKICEKFGIETNGSFDRMVELVQLAMVENNKDLNTIDFDDMIYFPFKLKLSVRQYDWVLGDECFPYYTTILLEDGTSVNIGEIVENKIQARVLTFNTDTGKQELKEITGWHKIPNSKPLVKVRAIQYPSCEGGVRGYVVCTEDHRVWVKNIGWVEAKNLINGMIIQRETSAKTNQKYKITDKGRQVLSDTISFNNKLGITGNKDGKYYGGNLSDNRGGNGAGLTEPQKILLSKLGEGWFSEYVVKPTKEQRLKYNSATHYKIDIANPDLGIAIELDGDLNYAEKIYEKKDKILKELGWKVYHYENYNAIRNIDKIIDSVSDCPIDIVVQSVDPVTINEYYVYDLTVEDNHNFYANGILVHNCQDWNRAQIELIKKSVKPGGRAVMVGDRKQCQPAGTKVLVKNKLNDRWNDGTTFSEVNIENLRVGDEIVSYSTDYGCFIYRAKINGISKRIFSGRMRKITTLDNKSHSMTPNHRCIAKWKNCSQKVYCVYLMRKDNKFRVGVSFLFSKNQGIGPLGRATVEDADDIWILKIFENRKQALIEEQYISYYYGIPQTRFNGQDKLGYDQETIDEIYRKIMSKSDLYLKVKNCLIDYNRDIESPLYSKGDYWKHQGKKLGKGAKFLKITASNLDPEWMLVPSINTDDTLKTSITKMDNFVTFTLDVYETEEYVYGLDVDKHHTYVSNGILTHNSMYGFRGADIKAMDNIRDAFDAIELPLSITYRCPSSHVDLVNQLFPEIPFERFEHAKPGFIGSCSEDRMLGLLQGNDLVLCRTNAPLVKPVFSLIRQGRKAVIRGRDIGEGLVNLIEKFNVTEVHELMEKLVEYRNKEVRKLLAAEKNNQAQALDDKVDTIIAISEDCEKTWQVIKKIEEVFSDKNEGIVFSTVHKAKGDEANRVFIFNPGLMPHPMAKSDWEFEQELNILYVALTRSKNELWFVNGPVPVQIEKTEFEVLQENWEEQVDEVMNDIVEKMTSKNWDNLEGDSKEVERLEGLLVQVNHGHIDSAGEPLGSKFTWSEGNVQIIKKEIPDCPF